MRWYTCRARSSDNSYAQTKHRLLWQAFLLLAQLRAFIATPIILAPRASASFSAICKIHFSTKSVTIDGQTAACIQPGDSFKSGACMHAGKYRLGFADGGALVASIANKDHPIVWSNGKKSLSSKPSVLVFKNNSISTRAGGKKYWTVDLKEKGVKDFCISTDGRIGLYDNKGKRIWSPSKPPCNAKLGTSKTTPDGQHAQCLTPGQRVDVCQSISAGDFKATMQKDGNFVLYRESTMEPLWDTGSSGSTARRFVYQTDGNIVLYDNLGNHLWASNTPDVSSNLLCIQPDGNIVAYDGANAVWDSGTTQITVPPTSSAASSSIAPPRSRTVTVLLSASSSVASPSPTKTVRKGTNPNDPFDISNSLFDGTCAFYLNTVKKYINASIISGNVNNNGLTLMSQYDCSINSFPRCTAGSGTWAGDANWVWNKGIDSSTDPYRYNVIWHFQLLGDSDDLFHECDTDPRAFDISKFTATPLTLKPNCITLGKWCRAWAGHVAAGKTINVKGQLYSVEDAFLKLSSNRIKIDFKDEAIDKSYLRSQMSLDEQIAFVGQFSDQGTGNCITDQHYCFECNGDPNHCSVAAGCLQYQWTPTDIFCPSTIA
ncbi:hypothetical protein BC830DRAFT_845050 [Chytriomyces sp. MP71]|nr:hypothetical protein BC830DRAFT_845050 [Chytriomyces sp. MP71]